MTTTPTDAKLKKVFRHTLDKLYEIHGLLDEDEVWIDTLAGVDQLEHSPQISPGDRAATRSSPRGRAAQFETLRTP